MNLTQSCFFDVLVIGSGIAGLSAAREAAALGCRTAILSKLRLFSGSSFYPGTWGFGLVGPENDDDIEDMIATINRVGCRMTDPDLVRTFVSGINPAISHLESLGCHPRKAAKSSEREYIPCFDHKHRNWNGLESNGLQKAFAGELSRYNVTVLDHCTAVELVKVDGRICGVIVSHENAFRYIGCRSLVLATGGFGSLFRNHLCTDDVCGLGHFLALKAGCSLINMEFMQMMPGYLHPARNTIFNEKTFRFANYHAPDHSPVFSDDEETLLDLRSTYGPFTSRLASRAIDLKLYQASLEGESGVAVSYANAAKNDPPEFIKIYFDWLASEKKVSVNDTIHIGIFSHAANGGIRIDSNGRTGVDGLYACGEVTGGMHGADRIGGLSTANGLVFGQRAGRAAAYAALKNKIDTPRTGPGASASSHKPSPLAPPSCFSFVCREITDRNAIRARLQNLMYRNAMVVRNESGLTETLDELKQILAGSLWSPSADTDAVADSYILEGQLMTAVCILETALLRRESRGSHYRSDFPDEDPALESPIEIVLDKKIAAGFISCGWNRK